MWAEWGGGGWWTEGAGIGFVGSSLQLRLSDPRLYKYNERINL